MIAHQGQVIMEPTQFPLRYRAIVSSFSAVGREVVVQMAKDAASCEHVTVLPPSAVHTGDKSTKRLIYCGAACSEQRSLE